MEIRTFDERVSIHSYLRALCKYQDTYPELSAVIQLPKAVSRKSKFGSLSSNEMSLVRASVEQLKQTYNTHTVQHLLVANHIGTIRLTTTELNDCQAYKKEIDVRLGLYRRVQQWRAFEFIYTKALHAHRGALLDAYMGFGKTLVALMVMIQTYLDEHATGSAVRPMLLLASPAVQSVWRGLDGDGHMQKHIDAAWVLPVLDVCYVSTDTRVRQEQVDALFDNQSPALVTCGYEFARDNPWLLQKSWQLVVCDEIQRLKNAKSIMSLVFYDYQQSPVLGLSGTYNTNRPLPNTYAVMKHLAPDLIHRYQGEKGKIHPKHLRDIERQLVIHVKEPTQAKRLRVSTIRWVNMTEMEQARCEELETHAFTSYRQITDESSIAHNQKFAAAIQALRRFADTESKLNAVCEDIVAFRKSRKDVTEPRLIILTNNLAGIEQMQYTLLTLKVPIQSVKYTGSMSRKERELVMTTWYSHMGPGTFFISTDAGCEGTDLTAADTMYLVNMISEYNPGKVDQALARIDRSGQTSDVVYYQYYGTCFTFDRALEFVRQSKRLAKRAIRSGDFKDVDTGVMQALRLVRDARNDLSNSNPLTIDLHPTNYATFRKQTLESVFPEKMAMTLQTLPRTGNGPELSLDAYNRQQFNVRQNKSKPRKKSIHISSNRIASKQKTQKRSHEQLKEATSMRTTSQLPRIPKKRKLTHS
jgi:superfamily II DNA or RNA helicase